MLENLVSKRTKQNNYLKARVQPFQTNFKESQQRIRSSSSMNNLASTVYSTRQNQTISPKKSMMKLSSVSTFSKFQNPQGLKTVAVKGLNTRASHIANYSDINTELLLQRKNLEDRSAFLREEIAKDQRLKNKADMNCKKLHNQLDKSRNIIKELTIKLQRLNESINNTRQDALNNKDQRNDRRNDNDDKTKQINSELQMVDELEHKCRVLKNNLLCQDKARTLLKGDLIMQQKIMKSQGILMSELQQERANLLLEINKSVQTYKLQ